VINIEEKIPVRNVLIMENKLCRYTLFYTVMQLRGNMILNRFQMESVGLIRYAAGVGDEKLPGQPSVFYVEALRNLTGSY
jgi:hypothetical protein